MLDIVQNYYVYQQLLSKEWGPFGIGLFPI